MLENEIRTHPQRDSETRLKKKKKSKRLKHKADDDMSSFSSAGKRKLCLEESHEASKIE